MYKYSFFNDYSEGAHPKVLELLTKTNFDQESGYGEDDLTSKAAKLIKKIIKNEKAEVHFVSAGTQANLIVLASILKPYESVIAAKTGHINVHEAGAVEATGHKINLVESSDAKVTVERLQEVLSGHGDEHMVKPRVVYISNSTELGTVYYKKELKAISDFCRKNGLYLFMDGARLGSALCSEGADLTLADIAKLVDAFYIGGTKNGALLGEAIVLVNPELQKNFRFHLKQRGALLAKGRILGAQFLALFQDNLYFELATHANKMAAKLTKAIKKAGYKFLTESKTNQIFPILPNKLIAKLQKDYGFYIWKKVDANNSAIRLVTSWATKEEKVDEFIKEL
ncbi:MAG: low specificity L-threonine aldolase [Patescibacteria group bacterium]